MKHNTALLETSGRSKKNFYVYQIVCRAGAKAIGAHWHEETEIIYAACDGIAELDTETVAFKKDSFIFVNKKKLHSVTAHSGGLLYALVFDFNFLDFRNDDYCQTEILDKLKNGVYIFPQFSALEQGQRVEITQLLQKIIALYYSGILGRELKIKCHLYEIIFLLYTNEKLVTAKTEHDSPEHLAYVKSTIALMEDTYSEHITVETLSSHANLSKYYLIKIFKQITGETPILYLRNLRLDSSRELLAKGHSITQTALMSGFNNVSYYIRHFKARNHVTPKKYQKGRMN